MTEPESLPPSEPVVVRYGSAASQRRPSALEDVAALVSQAPFGLAVFDRHLRYLLISRGLAEMHGQDPAGTVGRRVQEVFPPPHGEYVADQLREVLTTGVPIRDVETWGTFAHPHAERCFSSSLFRLEDEAGLAIGVMALVTEVTEVRLAEMAANAAVERLHVLWDLTTALSESRDVADVAATITTRAARALGAAASALLTARTDDRSLRTVASAGFDESVRTRLVPPAADALQTERPTLWGSPATGSDRRRQLQDVGAELGSWAFVPLVGARQRLGVACFAWSEERSFDAAERALIDAVARQCTVALARARHLEAEQETRQVVEFLAEMAKLVIEAADDGVFAVSSHGQVLAFNRRFCELVGIPSESVRVGGEAWQLVEPCLELVGDPDALRAHVRDTVTRPLAPFDVDVVLKDGRILSAHAAPIVSDDAGRPLGRVWYVRDETDRRVSEAAQRSLVQGLRERQDSQAFLLGASEIVAGADGYRETLERLASVAVPTLADLCLVDVVGWDGRVERVAARHADPALQPLANELRTEFAPDPGGIHPAVEVLRSGRTRWSPTMSDDFLRRTTRNSRHLELVRRLGFTSYMVVPLFGDNRVLGSITLISAGSGRRYGPRDVDLADEFATHVAQVVANAHRNDTSRRAAHTLQSSLLPERLTEVPGVAISVRYLPATVDSEVGGDFYDVFIGRDGTAYFAIGDVAGHDVTAAAIMGRLRSAARALATEARGPAVLVEMLHRSWENLEADRIATMLVAALDPRTGALELASAGHLAPLVVTEDDASFVELRPSVPLGAPPPGPVPGWRGRLPVGSTLLMFTDGLIEDRGHSLEDSASELARVAVGPAEPKALCDRVLDTFVTDDLRRDDIALMALARMPAL